jgi:hypothetical protein
MSAPHNKERYGELWPQWRVDIGLQTLEQLKDLVVISGGWAWHFMSPAGHPEYKHAHDHKDLDLFVLPANVSAVMVRLQEMGFLPAWTRYDRLDSKEDFRRYEKTVPVEDKTTRITIDFFVRDVPSIERHGFRVVPPATLLTFYQNIHSSDKCFAVKAAHRLIAQGKEPVGHPDLVKIPR